MRCLCQLLHRPGSGRKPGQTFRPYRSRLSEIGNCLFCQAAIARASGKTEQEVAAFFAEHSLVPPADSSTSNVAMTIREAHAKELLHEGADCLRIRLKASREDIAKSMSAAEVPEDIKTFLKEIHQLYSWKGGCPPFRSFGERVGDYEPRLSASRLLVPEV